MLYDQVVEATEAILARHVRRPALALVLGSGLGDLAGQVEDAVTIPYDEIPHFVRSTVAGHAGRLLVGMLAGMPIVAMQGRFHFYEGYSPQVLALPIRVMYMLGARTLMAGPSFETAAELRFLRMIGTDAVGMSTVPEVVVARHMAMRVLGLSLITNTATGNETDEINHAGVLATADASRPLFAALVRGIVEGLATMA